MRLAPQINSTAVTKAIHIRMIDCGWSFVGNRYVTADRIRFIVRGMNEKETQRVVGSYPVGKAVTVYYDPRDVTASVVEPGIWWPMIPILALSITMTLMVPAIFYSDFRKRN